MQNLLRWIALFLLVAAQGALAERHTWFVNPATGNDADSGLDPAHAWKTAGKINAEADDGVIQSTSDGTENGDVLVIDTSRAPLELGDFSLDIPTDGITIRPAAGQRYAVIRAEKKIAPASWTPTSGYAHVFQTNDTGTDIVVWENDRWMHHPTGANFAAVATTLESTPGSFWTDGATLYVHPFNGVDPSKNRRTYTRSQFRGNGDSAILMSGNNWSVSGLRVRKTCLARKNDNDPYVGYCFQQIGGSISGTCNVKDCYFDFGSKHLIGFTADSTDSTVLAENLTCEQASPYVGYGGQTAFVSYMAAGSGNVHIYKNCRSIHNAGRIGYSTGEVRGDYPVFVTHGAAGAYASLQFLGCQWSCAALDDQGTVADGGLVVENSRLAEATMWSPNVSIKNSRIKNWCEIANGGILRDSRLTSTTNFQSRSPAKLGGSVTVENCTLDLRANPTPGGFRLSPWSRSGPLSLTFHHNTFLAPPANDLTLISNLSNADHFSFSGNVYALGAGGWLIGSYAGGSKTFNQWQTLGYDLNSVRLR